MKYKLLFLILSTYLFANSAGIVKQSGNVFLGNAKKYYFAIYSDYKGKDLNKTLKIIEKNVCKNNYLRGLIEKGKVINYIYVDKKENNFKVFVIDSCKK